MRRFWPDQPHLTRVNGTVAAIECDPFAFAHRAAIGLHGLRGQIDLQILGAHDAAFAPPARHHRRVAGLSSGRGQNSLRHIHSTHIFGTRFVPHQNDFLSARRPVFRFVRRENCFAHRRAWHRIVTGHEQSVPQFARLHLGIDDRIEQPLDILRLHAFKCFFNCDQLLARHVDGDPKRRRRRALAIPRLQHVQLSILDREFHVLHVAKMLLEFGAHLLQLLVGVRHDSLHFGQLQRRADSRHHILALGVHQKFPEENLLAGRRVARKTYPCAGIFAGIPENHLYHAGRRPSIVRNLFRYAISLRFLSQP